MTDYIVFDINYLMPDFIQAKINNLTEISDKVEILLSLLDFNNNYSTAEAELISEYWYEKTEGVVFEPKLLPNSDLAIIKDFAIFTENLQKTKELINAVLNDDLKEKAIEDALDLIKGTDNQHQEKENERRIIDNLVFDDDEDDNTNQKDTLDAALKRARLYQQAYNSQQQKE